ncbi:S-type Pyocin [Klebsiella pneumoniae]|nr:S-type Pyocin [Klebsiella pneumoniae]
MTQILGPGEGKTSSAAKEPVVERKPAQVFFESMALAASMSGYYAGPTATTLGNSLSLGAGTAAGVGEGVAGARVLAAPNPLTVALLAIFYSPSLNEGETEMLQDIRGDQLYQNLIHGQMMVGAFTRVNSTVIQGDYVPEYELREIARQNGTVRTRVRFRIEEDPESGELVSRSYKVGEKSGLDRVRVRFAKQLDKETWGFEDPSIKGTFVWSRSAGRENLSGEPARRLSMTGALAALPHRLHPFRNRGASGDCLTRPRNRYRPYRERRSRRNRDQILKHCPSKTGISMTLLLLTRWGLSRQSMCILRKPLWKSMRLTIMKILKAVQGRENIKSIIFHLEMRFVYI